MKINNFRGDLADISAKKEALVRTCHTCTANCEDAVLLFKSPYWNRLQTPFPTLARDRNAVAYIEAPYLNVYTQPHVVNALCELSVGLCRSNSTSGAYMLWLVWTAMLSVQVLTSQHRNELRMFSFPFDWLSLSLSMVLLFYILCVVTHTCIHIEVPMALLLVS